MQDIIPPGGGRKSSEEGLKMISHCPVCHYGNNAVEANVLEESDSAHLVYIKCQRCKSAVLALFSSSNMGMSSMGVITDLESTEVSKFKDLPRVSDDDVLSIGKALLSNNAFLN
jgi:hypothetical protein